MEISHATHGHKLVLKYAKCPYYCKACDQLGFGLTYVCGEECNVFLHKQCGKPETQIDYPFSQKCVMKFREGGPGVDSMCDACGKKIKRFHYRCTCLFVKRHLHPSCLGYEKTLDAANGLSLRLEKVAASKCLYCEEKDVSYKVSGWAYVSSCGTYCYHVACVKEIINKNWKNAFFTGISDPFQTIKERFPEDVDRMDRQLVAPKKRIPKTKHVVAVLKILFNTFTGNHFGLIGAAQVYFGS